MVWLVLQDPALGCNSYILGDESHGVGMVVDPLGVLGADTYILAAQESGIAIAHVVETHVHADHASAAAELAAVLGLPVTFGSAASPGFPHVAVQDGDTVMLGQIEVTVWHTPGHTPDSISLLVADLTRSPDPWLVMTGDSLFVGDVGRPDLGDVDPELIRAAAADQYNSVRRLMELPDYTEIHPAHYGSSPCGGLFMSRKPHSTIGYERRCNRLLAAPSAAAFIEQQLQLLKPPPPEAAAMRLRNLGATQQARQEDQGEVGGAWRRP